MDKLLNVPDLGGRKLAAMLEVCLWGKENTKTFAERALKLPGYTAADTSRSLGKLLVARAGALQAHHKGRSNMVKCQCEVAMARGGRRPRQQPDQQQKQQILSNRRPPIQSQQEPACRELRILFVSRSSYTILEIQFEQNRFLKKMRQLNKGMINYSAKLALKRGT